LEARVSDTPGAGDGPLSVLSAGAAALARAVDLDTALTAIVEAGASATGASMATLFSLDPDRPNLELLLTLGVPDEDVAMLRSSVVDDPDHPIHRAALDRTGSLGRETTTPHGETATLVDLPLVVAGGGVESCVGVLSFGWRGTRRPGSVEATMLVGTADLAAAAIAAFRASSMATERAEWFERIAHTDPLTGLSNARSLARVLELEVARAQRQGGDVSVAVFDVDGFTALNRSAGTRTGDRVLRQVAAVLSETVRMVDTVARTGGDEFVIIAPGSAGAAVARRVLDGIGRLEAIEGHPVTVSAGVARFPHDGTDAEALLAAARDALRGAEQASITEAAHEPSS
jgi:diguanylate cyclase (GGDEF)-like protein